MFEKHYALWCHEYDICIHFKLNISRKNQVNEILQKKLFKRAYFTLSLHYDHKTLGRNFVAKAFENFNGKFLPYFTKLRLFSYLFK